ncbi:hypothetical protein GCM10009846_30650 [Agrococcus versicolor]|uniref:Uncharacterized protein n=1 Tax=Agrococcus versicolor TaxID=501482 RepID=A0ABP5MUB9_9MICO
MAVEIPSAVEWARAVPRERLRLADLDAHLLRHDHDALRALGRRRLDDAGGGAGSGVGRGRAILLGLLALVALVAPAAGFAIAASDGRVILPGTAARPDVSDPVDAAVAFPVVALCFAIATLLPLASLIAWARRRRMRILSDLALPIVTLGLALLTIPVLVRRAGEGADATGALVATSLAAATSVAVLAALLLASRAAERTRDWFPAAGTPDVAKAAAAIALLPESARAGMVAERSDALAALVERGLLDAAARRRAEEAPLGSLVAIDRDRTA